MTVYWIGSALAWGALTAIAWRLWRIAPTRRTTPPGDARHTTAAVTILLVAAALRLPLAIGADPLLSTDLWRYLLDGRHVAEGTNPYSVTPRERRAAEPDEAWLARINHPHLATIYQPASQAVFGATAAAHRMITGRPLAPPTGQVALRLVLIAFDLGIIALLLIALRAGGRSAWWAVLYAWHPLAVTETAWSGHQEPIGILALLAALLAARHAGRSGAAVGVGLAIAAAVKPVVAPVAMPIAWRWLRSGRWRTSIAAGVAGGAALGVLYVPFLLMEGGLTRMVHTARVFAEYWEWNGSLHAAAWWALGDKVAADRVCGGALAVVLLAATWRARDAVTAAMAFLFAAVLLSSTAHPWYLLWALALLPIRPGAWFAPAIWVASLTMAWSYAAVLDVAFKPPGWVVWLEYVPVYLAVILGAVFGRRSNGRSGTDPD